MKRLLPILALLLAGCATAAPTVWLAGKQSADFNGDGTVNPSDLLQFKTAYAKQLGTAGPPRYVCIAPNIVWELVAGKGVPPADPVAAVKACWP